MKKILVSTIVLLLIGFSASAQYKMNKKNYNHKDYVWEQGDRYSPALAGVASLFVPGLGQMVSGEVGRGVGFLGGYVGSLVIYSIGSAQYANTGTDGAGLAFFGLASAATIGIWSIIDAVHVAKVNNMALRQTSSLIKIQPYICNVPFRKNISAGLSIQMKL